MSNQFTFDVFNNTGHQVNFVITGNLYLKGAIGNYAIAPGAWLSAQNGNAPLPLQLLNDTGSLDFQVSVNGSAGNFVLEFDSTNLVNFPGMAFYGSAGDIANPVAINDAGGEGYIFPFLYMNQLYGGSPLAVLMLVETTGASSGVATPYQVS